jgi:hypothetical protein
MGDDIGWMQVGVYHRGLALGEAPNIDRIGEELRSSLIMSARSAVFFWRTLD